MIEKIIKKRAKRSVIWSMPSDKFRELVKNSKTIADILKPFGLANKGGNHHTVKRRMNEEHIDYSHIKLGLDANKGRTFDVKPLDYNELFRKDSLHSRSTLKKYILRNNLIPYKCEQCGLEGQWQGKNLVLVLDHINGINNDNRIENLRFLCPNCNSQQNTFAGKNVKHSISNHCNDCGQEISKVSTRCVACLEKFISDNCKRPSKEDLLIDIENKMSNIKIGQKYNVSETSVRKWRKYYKI